MTEQKYSDEIQVEDGEDYRGGSKGRGIKEIILAQLEKCTREGGMEMDGGGTKTRLINGQTVDIIMPNQREIFINNCEMLRILVNPYIKKHHMKVDEIEYGDFRKKLNALNQDEADKMKRLEDSFKMKKSQNIKSQFNAEIKKIHEQYEVKRVKLYRDELLNGISFLLNFINYFEEIDEVWYDEPEPPVEMGKEQDNKE